MLNKIGRRLLAALAVAGAAIAPQAAAAKEAPALWSVSDHDTTIYLFGTIHLLPADYKWETPAFQTAVADSHELVIETIVDPAHPQPYLNALTQLGFARGLPPITERVPASKRPALLAAIAKSGIPQQQFDQMKTWNAAFRLLQLQFMEMGLQGDDAPETVLREAFTAAGKPVDQLETNYEQLSFFDRLPEASQRQLLEGSLESLDVAKKEFDGMLASWAHGDVQGVAKTFNEDLAQSPEVQRTILRQRNSNWSKWVERRMAQPGTIMVAVGAGHLAGSASLIEQLKRDGLHVRRLQ
jgi:uncharacterized protein YbaP (TraB family)